MDVWSVVLGLLPVPAGKGEQRKNECSQHHTAPTKVKRQVIRLRPVKEPPWKVMTKQTQLAGIPGKYSRQLNNDKMTLYWS